MADDHHLRLGLMLIRNKIAEISDSIVKETWQKATSIAKICESNQIVTLALEVNAFFLHATSRNLPAYDNDYLNELIYSPIVNGCCESIGRLVDLFQESGSITPAVFFGEDVEIEAKDVVCMRDEEYGTCTDLIGAELTPKDDVVLRASKVILITIKKKPWIPLLSPICNELASGLTELKLQGHLSTLCKVLDPEMRTYIAKIADSLK